MEPTTNPAPIRRIVLIDDDLSFGHIMRHMAQLRGIELDYYPSLADLGFVALLGQYDVAIIDYDLGLMTGAEIGEYLRAFLAGTPMLLVSGSLRKANAEDLASGKAMPFMHKKNGYDAILSVAWELTRKGKGDRTLTNMVGLGVA